VIEHQQGRTQTETENKETRNIFRLIGKKVGRNGEKCVWKNFIFLGTVAVIIWKGSDDQEM
jgi:hypothetical protein